MERRLVIGGLAAFGLLAGARAGRAESGWAALPARLAAIEAGTGGRLGVGVLGATSGPLAAWRGDERFPMCSTHKALSAAAVLALVDAGREHLDRVVRFAPESVLPYSPVTGPQAGGPGMTLGGICAAAVTLSDNTAANLIFAVLGGPAGLTEFLRGTGDAVTRSDRTEPTLNEALPGDKRDTSTPVAFAATLGRLLFGTVLSPACREQLAAWLVDGRTGAARLRAGVPPGWRVGDKTGTGERGSANDVAALWPPGGEPLVVTAFITESAAPLAAREAAMAEVARAVVAALG